VSALARLKQLLCLCAQIKAEPSAISNPTFCSHQVRQHHNYLENDKTLHEAGEACLRNILQAKPLQSNKYALTTIRIDDSICVSADIYALRTK
jgi:hypothetical protein